MGRSVYTGVKIELLQRERIVLRVLAERRVGLVGSCHSKEILDWLGMSHKEVNRSRKARERPADEYTLVFWVT